MKRIQIEALRDAAIAALPRAQSFRQKFSRFGSTEEAFYGQLTAISVSVQGNPVTPAIETAAARVLLTVSLLLTKREEALTKPQRADLIAQLRSEAHELCETTGIRLPWLNAMQVPPDEEEQQEAPAPPPAPTLSIEGKLLTTDQVAEILSVKPATVTTWARKQKGPILPASRVGREYRFSGDEVLALMQSKSMPKPRKSK